MSLWIYARPNALSWSRNEMRYHFAYTYPIAGDRVYMQLQDSTSLTVLTEVSYPVDVTVSTGYMSIPTEKVMDPLTAWVPPSRTTPGAGAQIIEELQGNIRKFKVRFRGAPPGYPISWVQDTVVIAAIKGGVGDMTFIAEPGVNSHAMALPNNSNMLTWAPNNRLQAPDEWGWLLYLSLISTTQRVNYYVNYLDGTQTVFTRAFATGGLSNMQYRNWYIPTGVHQAGLDPAGIGVQSVSVIVERDAGSGAWAFVAGQDFKIDYRPDYHPLTLYYRNSLGGWDNLRLRGARERSSDVERKEADAPAPFVNGRNPYYDATLRPKWKASTGFISAEHLAALDDLLMSTECALLYNGTWLQVRITSKNFTPIATKNNLHSTVVEFEASGSFHSFPNQLANLR